MVGDRWKAIRWLGAVAMAGILLVACTRGAESTTSAPDPILPSANTGDTGTVAEGPDATNTNAATLPATTANTAATTTTDPGTTSTGLSSTTVATTGDPVTNPEVSDPVARPESVVSNMNRGSVDDFDPTGDDIYRVALELVDLFNYLEGNPTGTAEEMAALMYEPDYLNWDGVVANFEEITDNPGWHYTDPGIHVIAVEVVDVSGDTATIRRVHERGLQVIRDTNDVVVRERQGWEPKLNIIVYHRGNDGRWRHADLISSVPATAEDVASMVPVEWIGRE